MARWIDLAPRQEVTGNQGGDMSEHRGVVLHIAQGSYDGTIAWQKNPTSDVSSHFIAAKDGRACQMVDTEDIAWTQKAGNGHWLSIENEGSVPDALTGQQIEFAAQILARAHREYRVPLQATSDPDGRGLGHHSMGAHPGYPDDWGHPACPGAKIISQKPAIVARAKEIIEESTMPTAAEIAKAVWDCDQVPAPPPPVNNPDWDTNKTWQADNALSEAVIVGRKNAAAIAKLAAKLEDGVPATLSPEQLQQLAAEVRAGVVEDLRALVFRAEP